jgi:hypothetical protein
VLIPLEPAGNGTWQGEAQDAGGRAVSVLYDATLGLRFGGGGDE